MEYVDLFGMIDPVYVPKSQRAVRYFAKYQGRTTAKTTSHTEARAWADAVAAEHGTRVVDCSDRGSGHLQAMLAASNY